MTALLDLKDVQKLLKLSDSTLRRLVYRRELCCIRLGGQLRFTEADVQRYIESKREPAVKLWKGAA